MKEFCTQTAHAIVHDIGVDGLIASQAASKSPNISEKAVAERFSKAAHRYDKLASIQHTIAQQGLQNLPAQLVGKALDIGCGTGVHTQSLNVRGLDAVGVDIAEGMLALAGTNYPHLTLGMAVRKRYLSIITVLTLSFRLWHCSGPATYIALHKKFIEC